MNLELCEEYGLVVEGLLSMHTTLGLVPNFTNVCLSVYLSTYLSTYIYWAHCVRHCAQAV